MIREISRRKCLRLWLCKPEYMERTKWENRFVLLRFRKKNYMMFLKDLKRFKMERLYDKLKAYSESDFYAFHMPGHKRNKTLLGIELPYDLDITEIDGFDDLHHADGILKEEQERAARVFGAEESHFLVNGSTVGILSAIAGVMNKGDQILVARNCHKSVYHAIYMNELNPVYLYPRFDSELQLNIEISAEDVRRALNRYPQIRAVMIVSPTYDGIVSDVAEIAKAAHEKGLPLIVDEALMVEPTETESKETLDDAIAVFRKLYELAETDPEKLHQAPVTTPVTRLDEVNAARHPHLRYAF